ncbi:conserved Plasmodium protein, unknown function [Plasmodium sp. DRC-Itaito]|nr:conserved Plasmodium protein, unknown function [Plasmodium sp. DRC-Itaito]
MCDFLGTKLTDYKLNDIKKEFNKKTKHYDEYDFYVYYKNLLASERRKKERKEQKKRKYLTEQEKEDEFKPCNYISSIYKRVKNIERKNIYDYIDENDNIYEDIVTNRNYREEHNFTDDITFTFFNENLSYTLLRNNNYIDGIPIGVNVQIKKDIQKKQPDNNQIYSHIENNDEHKEITQKEFKYQGENKYKETKGNNKIIGPQMPHIFEEMRKQMKNEEYHNINQDNIKAYENEYVNILSYQNYMISIKRKEQKEYERYIQLTYIPKNNFEGAFYVKDKNDIKEIKNNEFNLLTYDFLHNKMIDNYDIEYEHENKYKKNKYGQNNKYIENKSNNNIYDNNIYDNNIYDNNIYDNNIYDKKIDDDNIYSNNYLKSEESISLDNKSYDSDFGSVKRREKNKEDTHFVLYKNNFLIKEQDIYIYYKKYYESLFAKINIDKTHKNKDTEHFKEIYVLYNKLLNLNKDEILLTQNELINLYVPKKSWTQFNSSQNKNTDNMTYQKYELKNQINFNNDLKKKNRFYFFCKMNENKNVKIKNILSIKEMDEFKDLIKKLKTYDPEFYINEIINEDLNTNFQICDYEFSKVICEKLNIKNKDYKDNEKNDEKQESKIIDDFLKIPQFVFESIFCS